MQYGRSWKVRGWFILIKPFSKFVNLYAWHRLSYDAAIAKAEKCKNHKKEKDRREAAEELEKAQYR